MINKPHFLFLNQSTSDVVYELAARVGRELGPTVLHTGTSFKVTKQDNFEVWPGPAYNNISYASRLKTWSAYSMDALRASAKIKSNPVVMVCSNPPFGPYLGYLLRRLRGWRYIVRILDVYPDILTTRKMFSSFNPLTASMAAANRLAFSAADEVITLAPLMGEKVARYMPAGKQLQIIPDWVDTTWLKPIAKSRNKFAAEHDQQKKLTVLYTGNYGQTHDLSAVFTVAAQLQSRGDIEFLFIGGGARRDELQKHASRLKNFKLLPMQPQETLPLSISTGDVALATLGSGTEGISMPSKTYYMMAAGCAILGISDGDNDLARLIEKFDCGVNVATNDIDELKRTILRFSTDKKFLAQCRNNSRRAAEEVFSEKICTGKYLEILKNLRRAAGPV